MDATDRVLDAGDWESPLTANERRYHAILSTLENDLVCCWLPDTTLTFVNAAYQSFFGRFDAPLVGQKWLDLVPSTERERVQELYQELAENPKHLSCEHWVVGQTGECRWFLWRDVPLFDEQGRCDEFLSIGRDITEHKQSANTLRERNDQLQQIITEQKKAEEGLRLAASVFSSSQEGIMITDVDNRIVDVNPAFTHITGYERAEVIGKNPRLLSSGRQDTAFYVRLWQSLRDTGTWQGEIWDRRKSGELYAERLSISLVTDVTGGVRHYVGVLSDITALKTHQEELRHAAYYDLLTGVPNRQLLVDRLSQGIAQAQRSERLLAICHLDLDGFKAINDQWGHDAGDQLLVEIACRLQSILRSGDTLARLGEDEFALLLVELDQDQDAYNALDRILISIATPIDLGDQWVSVSASIGVTLYPQDGEEAGTLLRQANQAMYQAKEAGKNRFYLFDSTHDRIVRSKREALKRLEEALNNREFVLYYQPKVHLLTGRVMGAEALIRWQHPERGLIAPWEFLPVLMGTHLEIGVGEWVIDTVLRQMILWEDAGQLIRVSVNVSAYHLQQPDFTKRLQDLLGQHPKVSASDLELEVLESSALEDLSRASQVLTSCMALGVRFSLDDFGTGYASLSYCRHLPVETLKIDQSFVRNMLNNAEDRGIVQMVINLAQTFNRNVIAEGVESPMHGTTLVRLGCLYGQGYAIARPMPAADIPDWIVRWQESGGISARLAVSDT
ncbi:diguanylate cyclase [Gammaproteobacteria bacterium]